MVEITTEQKSEAESWFLTMLEQAGNVGEPVSSFVKVDPAMASVLLASNPDNRNLRPTKLQQIEEDMRHGRWAVNGESVIISKGGELNDGQHRLTGIFNTGIAQFMNLVFGVERDSRFTIDTGSARSAGDHLGLSGVASAATVAAMCRLVLSYEMSGGPAVNPRITSAEIIERVKADAMLREIGAWAHANGAKLRGTKIEGRVAGAAFYILQKKYPKQALNFMDSLAKGAMLPASSPIYRVRIKISTAPRLSSAQRFELIMRAWNAWIRDETIDKFMTTGNMPTIRGPKKATANA